MFGGGGGLNPRKMQKMMEQMGIEMEELDAEEVVISLADGDALVFTDVDVTMMEAQGQETYQVVGSPERKPGGAGSTEPDAEPESEAGGIPDDDIELVVQRTGASPAEAREALEAEDGDLAAAISRLE
jgi:nascent polypeptide-associated complex subunit alpha